VVSAAPSCSIGPGDSALDLEPEQAADAATIAAVAKRRGLADHAATIAIAAALQESKLFNVGYGDRDSVGVFQQRPSQGWGTRSQLLSPAFAANAFFSHLERIPGWQSEPVATAAQQVQHSADGSAYAQWESQARLIASTFTGEFPAKLNCQFQSERPARRVALLAAADLELGPDWQAGGSQSRDWEVGSWLVAHAYQYGVTAVTVRGLRWTHDNEHGWVRDARAGDTPSFEMTPPRPG
jgi:hypothetical protein